MRQPDSDSTRLQPTEPKHERYCSEASKSDDTVQTVRQRESIVSYQYETPSMCDVKRFVSINDVP